MDFRDIKEFIKDTFKYFIVIVFILFIAIYVISIQQIVGPSMNPNLKNGDIVILNKLIYNIREVKRNEIVSINYEDMKYLTKRIIGLPGEIVEYKDNQLYINGEKYPEKFLSDTITNDFKLSDLKGQYIQIPDNMYLVLGDNREDSMDSRDFGLIKKENIIGKVMFKIWPLNNFKMVK